MDWAGAKGFAWPGWGAKDTGINAGGRDSGLRAIAGVTEAAVFLFEREP